jgi:DNA-binding CsgD family transcriptional regulator
VSIRIALVDENQFEALLIADALIKKGIEVTHLWHSYSNPVPAFATLISDVLMMSISEDAEVAVAMAVKKRIKHPHLGLVLVTSTPDLRLLGISENELPNGVQVILRSSVRDLHVLSRAIHDSVELSKIQSSLTWVTGKSFTDVEAFISTIQALTLVQIQTLRLVAQGRSNAEIARIRFVTEKAVEHTITRILQALKITTNPLNNSRVLLSREYYRWVDVAKHSH